MNKDRRFSQKAWRFIRRFLFLLFTLFSFISTILLVREVMAPSPLIVGFQLPLLSTPVPPPIERLAEFAYPPQLQAERPVTIRFSLFESEHPPNELPGAETRSSSAELPARPGLEAWVSAKLYADNKLVANNPEQEEQQLSERNIWLWEIRPEEAQLLVFQPILDVEYRTAEGQVVDRYQNVWTDTYAVDVIKPGYGQILRVWLSNCVNEVLIALAGTAIITYVLAPARTRVLSWRSTSLLKRTTQAGNTKKETLSESKILEARSGNNQVTPD